MKRIAVISIVVLLTGLPIAANAATPSNDDFANASAISSLPFQTSESTIDATTETNEPNPVCLPLDHTVWFRYKAPRNANLVANLSGTDFYVAGGVYTGTSLSNLKAVGCWDTTPSDHEAVNGFSVSAGKTYFLQIGSLEGFPGGELHVRIEPAATIQGTVRSHNGRVLNNACVSAYDLAHLVVQTTTTNRSGMYTIPFLPGGDYRIKFEDCGPLVDAPEWYNNAGTFSTAETVTVGSGKSLKGISATLSLGGSISGVLTVEGSGDPAVDACIRVYDADGVPNATIPNAAADGSYSIGQLASGTYRLEFNGEACAPGYFPEWYSDKQDFASADPVVVSTGQAITGIDAALRSTAGSGSISGTVTDDLGNPVDPICVDAVLPNEVIQAGVLTQADGSYTITGLATGTYKVLFGQCWSTTEYVMEWYQEKSDISSADPVSVTDGVDTPGIDEVMTPASP